MSPRDRTNLNRMHQVPSRPMPRPTAQVQPYVDALGAELAMRFLLSFGGSILSVSKDPKGRSAYEALIGRAAALRLAEQAHRLQRRVPLANGWLAEMLAWQGFSVSHIARTIRASDNSVRLILKKSKARTWESNRFRSDQDEVGT